MSVKALKPKELRDWILEGRKLTIYDVRDEDFVMGNIPGCINVPAQVFTTTIPSPPTDVVVFHCALSQVRGPKCASYYSRLTGKDSFVLSGGFVAWQSLYSNESNLVENHNKKYFEMNY